VVESYSDRAMSGASLIRPGIQALLTDALRSKFEVVLSEALDRISRDQEDVAGVYKRMVFAGVKIVTLSEGEIGHLHVGLKGTMNALFLRDLADKTRRGMRGRVEAGKAGGGLPYGYEVVARRDAAGEPIRGERRIDEEQADIVRRIFREFAAGKSPIAIATDLNREGVPAPFGRTWGDSTIRGHASRHTGMLNNDIYIGKLVWNRQRFVKDPDTGKRVPRSNPETEWIRTDVPELRIVDDVLWQAVKARQAEIAKIFEPTTIRVREARAKRLNAARRPVFLLSGLLICGCCGGKYGIIVDDRFGCLNHHNRRTCDNGRSIRRAVVEQRVLAGLTEKLVSPAAVADAVRAYHEESNRRNHERRAQADADRNALAKIERAIRAITAAIEDGMYQPSMKARMTELEQQKAEIEAREREAPAVLPDVNPNIAEIYRAKVARLAEALVDPDARREAAEAIRALIGSVVLTPGQGGRGHIDAVLRGDLFAILDLAGGRQSRSVSPAIATAEAGPRYQLKNKDNSTNKAAKSGYFHVATARNKSQGFPPFFNVWRRLLATRLRHESGPEAPWMNRLWWGPSPCHVAAQKRRPCPRAIPARLIRSWGARPLTRLDDSSHL
jgi:site-specific DNA recombinase